MPEEKPRKSSPWFACLVKGPLGCLAYLFGATLVLVLFLPSAAGRLGDRFLERTFARHFEGTLELGEAWLGSFYNQQRIESLIVRDPDDGEVLHGSLRAPALGLLLGREPRGTIELHLTRLNLVEFPDGTTNLERAFRRRETDGEETEVTFDLPSNCQLSVTIDRLRWSDAQGRGGLLADLSWSGSFELRPRRLNLALEGGSDPGLADALRARVEYESLNGFSSGPWAGRFALLCNALPLGLARHAAGAELPVGLFEDDVLDELAWTREGPRGTLALRDEGIELECAGLLDEDGLLRGEPGLPARLRLPLGTQAGEFLLARSVPFLVPAVLAGEGPVEFQLEEPVLPRDGDWTRLAGRLRFRLPAGSFGLDPQAFAQFGESFRPAPLDLSATLAVVDGELDLAGLALPLEQGMLEYDGRVELASGKIDVSFTRSQDGERRPLGRWRGAAGALKPATPAPPAPPE